MLKLLKGNNQDVRVMLLLKPRKVSVFGVILVSIFPEFSRIWTEYGEILSLSDQNNSEYGDVLRSVKLEEK